MITIRCTARAAKHLGVTPNPDAPSGTSILGDWFLNLIPTYAGGMLLFVNERSLVSLCVPAHLESPMNEFYRRVGSLLAMLKIPHETIYRELEHYHELIIGKTNSRVILGSMNELAYLMQCEFDKASPQNPVSLSDLEMYLAIVPMGSIRYKSPGDVAREILGSAGVN